MDDETFQLSIRFALYSVIGGIVIVFNTLTILIYASDKEYRSRFLLYEMLCFAELINGANFLTAGLGRYTQLASGSLWTPIESTQCLFGMAWPILMIIGETYPASMTFLLSVERLFAVTCFTEFRRNNHKVVVAFLGLFYPAIMVMTASTIVIFSPQTNSNRMCGTTAGISPIYGLVQNLITIFLYLISLVISIIVYSVIKIYRKCSQTEIRYMRTLLAINGISCCFVAFPNILLIENNLGPIKFSDLFQGIVYSLYGIQSGVYFFVFYFFRFEFQRRVRRIFCGIITTHVVSQTNSGQRSKKAIGSKTPNVLVEVVEKTMNGSNGGKGKGNMKREQQQQQQQQQRRFTDAPNGH